MDWNTVFFYTHIIVSEYFIFLLIRLSLIYSFTGMCWENVFKTIYHHTVYKMLTNSMFNIRISCSSYSLMI